MNLPNAITLIRVVLIPFFVDLMIYGYHGTALVVFIIAGLTDALDGSLARLLNQKTELGAFLDPMADKLLILSAFVTLVVLDRIPVWLAVIVISRDVILVLGSLVLTLMGHPLKVVPTPMGKATTVLQLLLVTVTLLTIYYGRESGFGPSLYWITAAFTIISGAQYVFKGMMLVDNREKK
jgi:cardiolipin synthase